MTTKWPDIILFNGFSSAGKSTLSKALQNELNHPYLHFGFDDLIFISPERYWKSAATPAYSGLK
jgi:chloramphenicol 3-O phosphotransferase